MACKGKVDYNLEIEFFLNFVKKKFVYILYI